MLSKVRLWVRGKLRMQIAGVANLVVALLLGIYSRLSSYPRLMRCYVFRWLPVARPYINGLKGLSKLETMKPAERGYYDGLGGSEGKIGIIDANDKGFKELAMAIKMRIEISQPFDSIVLEKWTRPTWDSVKNESTEDIRLTLKLISDNETIREMPIESTKILRDAIEEIRQRRFAILTLILTLILFAIGITLVSIDLVSK